ncbi:MAG: BLUF domain-containing protein [Usitatibacteraceae bacterium]
MLVSCLYASRAREAAGTALLDEILEQSRHNNPKRGITGLLCYANEVFVQVLEGGGDEVSTLFNRITQDPRHQGVRLLAFEEIDERRFGNWTMGQVNVDTLNPAVLLKYSERARLDPFSSSGKATMNLLMELVATGAINKRGS